MQQDVRKDRSRDATVYAKVSKEFSYTSYATVLHILFRIGCALDDVDVRNALTS